MRCMPHSSCVACKNKKERKQTPFLMVPDIEKARVTELHVRMDCNGCVQRIKKAMHGVDGVYNVYVDFAQQKMTVVGNADPERIVKAIKKTRKIATICSHTDQPAAAEPSPPPPTEPAAATGDPPATAAPPPPPADPTPPPEPAPKDAPPPENPAPEIKPSPEAKDDGAAEIHMVHYYPHNIVYSYRASPSHCVSEFGYLPSPPREAYCRGAGASYHDGYYHSRVGRDGNQVTSLFSEENPNACRIV